MRVLHVGCGLDPLARAGRDLLDAWPTLAGVASAVNDAGAEVTVLQTASADEVFERDGVVFHFIATSHLAQIPGTRGSAGILPWRLFHAAAALQPDVIHLNGFSFPLHARALGWLGCPLLVQDHNDAPPRRHMQIHRWGLARIDGAVFTATEQAEPFFDAGIISRGIPIFEVPESSTSFTPGDVLAARSATGVYGDPAILWIGRLDENKDPLTVMDAVARAARRLPDAQLWCCFTAAPLLARVEARLDSDPALAARVHPLGSLPHADVESLCRAADFLMLGSHFESTGYAVIEALACGATPILSDIPAFRALTGRGSVGALVPVGDAGAFADALITLARRDRDVLRIQAIDHFRRELSFPTIGNRLVAIYRELVGRHWRGLAGVRVGTI